MDFTDVDLTAFKASLKSGYGFTKACQYIMRDVKEMSEIVKTDPDFKALCEDCIKAHIRALLAMGQQHLVDKDFDKFDKQNGFMTRYVGKLTIWAEFSTPSELDQKKFLKAVYIYKYPEEVATAVGMTIPEMHDYIVADGILTTFLSKKGWI